MTEGTKNILYAIFWASSIVATFFIAKSVEENKSNKELSDLTYQIDTSRVYWNRKDSLSTLKFDSLVNSRILKDSVYIYNQNKIIVKYAFKKDSLRTLPIDSNIKFLTRKLTNK